MSKKFSLRALPMWLWLILGVIGVSACTTPATPEVPTATLAPLPTATPEPLRGKGDTLRLLYWQVPTTLNPHFTTSAKDQVASRIVYEPLASFNEAGQLVPFLAVEIPSQENGGVAPDGKSVTWKLRQDVKWSDGEAFTAEDVRFTFDYITNAKVASSSASGYSGIQSVEVVDPYTVKVVFKGVTPAWYSVFVGIQGAILPKHVFEAYNNEQAKDAPVNLQPIGTGPYRFVEYKTEDIIIVGNDTVKTVKIVYEPNPFFRDPDKPFFRRVELQGGGDANVAAKAVLQEGKIDVAFNLLVEAATLANLEAVGKGRTIPAVGGLVEHILINRTDPNVETADGERSSLQFPHPILSDLAVRQAIAYAINRDAVVQLYPKGHVTAYSAIMFPADFRSTKKQYEYDVEKAKQLLDEANWTDADGDGIREKDGVKLRLTFVTSVNPVRQATQESIKKDLRAVGIQVEIVSVDASVIFGAATNSNSYYHFPADLLMFSEGNRSPDPAAYLRFYTSDQIPQKANNWKGENVERWQNSSYDALYQAALKEVDPDKRRTTFIEMNDLLVDDVVIIPLVSRASIIGVVNSVVGVNGNPWDAATWNIMDWSRNP